LLNLGHTFGHAFEAACGFSDRLLHGEAVAVGMCLAAQLSTRLGLADAADGARLAGLLARFGLPTALPAGSAAQALLAHMRLDKKNRAGRLRLVLWRGIGRSDLADAVAEADVRAVL
jgi:3-dehydroquinate synthase